MKLLHPEVDITPGRPGQRPQTTPVQEALPLPGSAVVRLDNATTQENAYTVRVRCEQPLWDESWYTVIALPPAGGAENAPPAGKRDERGPQDRWVKLYVPRGGSRDVLIRFNVPARPDARAGKYPYTVQVETQVVGAQADNSRRKDRVANLPAVAIVRPFYKWTLELSPEEKRVGRRHRGADFEAVVTNEGNDWLYCDLHLPRPKDMQIDAPTLRLAVPPPEPGETLSSPDGGDSRPGTQRTVPLAAATRLKAFRGEVTRQPLAVTAQRVDAPSVAPAVGDGYAGSGAVVASPTQETAPLPGDRALLYCPPIPAKFTDFFSRGAGSVQQWIMPVIGLVILVHMSAWFFENLFRSVKIDTLSEPVAGKKLVITGPAVIGTRVFITGKKGNEQIEPRDLGVAKPVADNLATNRAFVMVPKDLDGVTGKITVKRVAFLPYIPALPTDSKNIQIGNRVQVATAKVTRLADGAFAPGRAFTVGVSGFSAPGTVLLNGGAHQATWASDHVTISTPQGTPGQQYVVQLKTPDGAALDAGTITIAELNRVAENPGGGGTAHPGGGGGGPVTPGGGGKHHGGGGGPGKGGGSAGGGHGGRPVPPEPPAPPKPPPGPKPIVQVPRPHGPVVRPVQGVPIPRPAPTVSPYSAVLAGSWDAAAGANDGSPAGLALKGYALVKKGDTDAAGPVISQALKLTDGQPGRARALALVAQGALADALGNKAQAVSSFQQAGGADDTCGLAYLAFADYAHGNGKDDTARKLLQGALAAVQTPEEKAVITSKLSAL